MLGRQRFNPDDVVSNPFCDRARQIGHRMNSSRIDMPWLFMRQRSASSVEALSCILILQKTGLSFSPMKHNGTKKQISIFTCGATTRKETHCLDAISDDVHHDTAHARYALHRVHETLDEKAPMCCYVTYVSDSAARHFKNKCQQYELCRAKYTSAKWLFSATRHGKNACDGVAGLVKLLCTAWKCHFH